MILRGKETFKICRNVSDPVMFKGLPLKLIYIAGAIIGIFVGVAFLLFSVEGVNPFLAFGVPLVGISSCIWYVRWFYRKYGIYGYELQQRDKSLVDTIKADKSLIKILKEK